MKKIFLSAALTLMLNAVFAQARLATADYQKTMQPAVENSYPFAEKTVDRAIQQKMEKLGYKGKDTKGYTVYRGVRLSDIGPDAYDLFFKVDGKKDNATVTLMISSGYDKFIGEADNSTLIDNSKKFLEGLLETVAAYDLEQQIIEQEEATKKADKRLTNLVEDGEDLQKKKVRLEKDIEENIKKQADQKNEAEKQRQILQTLIGKRKQ